MQILRRMAHWQLPLAVVFVCAIAGVFGEPGREVLRYERDAIAEGEFWRLLSGHIVHLGPGHLLLNLSALLLVWLLVGRLYTTRDWLLVMMVSVLVMDAGFWLLDPTLRWYVGLSGLLHGVLVGGAIRGLKTLPAEAMVILAAVAAKLVFEQWVGPLPGSETAAAGAVVVNAHLFGAAGGVLAGFALRH